MATFLPYAFFLGKITKLAKAQVPIMTNALHYGTGVFEGLRVYKAKNELLIFRMKDHYRRLLDSLRLLGVQSRYSLKQLCEITGELVLKNSPQSDAYLRPLAYSSSLELTPNLNRDSLFELLIYGISMGEHYSDERGVSTMVSTWERVRSQAIPSQAKITGNYANMALARKEATDNKFDEAIFLTSDGFVSEGAAANIFLVKRNKLITPSRECNILEGITRDSILTIARDLGITTEERVVKCSELHTCDEAFFTGTGAEIAWITQIDQTHFSNKGPVTLRLQQLYRDATHGRLDAYKHWTTPLGR